MGKDEGWAEVMLDLETLGTRADAAILQIGAVAFDPATGELGGEFMERVALPQPGRWIEADTWAWWCRQMQAGRPMPVGATGLTTALREFSVWLGDLAPAVKEAAGDGAQRRVHLWGNGPSFDCALLADAYSWAARARPWPYWGERCLRTLLANAAARGWKRPRVVPAHDALEDARAEAVLALSALRHLAGE